MAKGTDVFTYTVVRSTATLSSKIARGKDLEESFPTQINLLSYTLSMIEVSNSAKTWIFAQMNDYAFGIKIKTVNEQVLYPVTRQPCMNKQVVMVYV